MTRQMGDYIIAIDQSTSATKAMLFNDRCEMLQRVNVEHHQYYPLIPQHFDLTLFISS